jgi:NAD(P)-dependent dehydrogenase (short-subunit alcohol dehydrogenase family)
VKSTILVTGAPARIGGLTACTLATEGHTMYGSMRDVAGRNATRAQAVRDHATANELDLRVVELNALSQGSPARAVQAILAEQGQVYVVVHNAGIGSRVGGALTEKHAGEEQGSSLLR